MVQGELRVDREAVTRAARELADIRGALDEIADFARRETLAPDRFGPLATRIGAGAAAVEAMAALRASFERSVPVLAELADGLVEAADRVVEADAEAARLITRAGGD